MDFLEQNIEDISGIMLTIEDELEMNSSKESMSIIFSPCHEVSEELNEDIEYCNRVFDYLKSQKILDNFKMKNEQRIIMPDKSRTIVCLYKLRINLSKFNKFRRRVELKYAQICNKKNQFKGYDLLKKDRHQRRKIKQDIKSATGIQDDILITEDVADMLRIHINTLQSKEWRERTGCPLSKTGKRLYITKKALFEWIRKRN